MIRQATFDSRFAGYLNVSTSVQTFSSAAASPGSQVCYMSCLVPEIGALKAQGCLSAASFGLSVVLPFSDQQTACAFCVTLLQQAHSSLSVRITPHHVVGCYEAASANLLRPMDAIL